MFRSARHARTIMTFHARSWSEIEKGQTEPACIWISVHISSLFRSWKWLTICLSRDDVLLLLFVKVCNPLDGQIVWLCRPWCKDDLLRISANQVCYLQDSVVQVVIVFRSMYRAKREAMHSLEIRKDNKTALHNLLGRKLQLIYSCSIWDSFWSLMPFLKL